MFLSYQHTNAGSEMWGRYLGAGLLVLYLGLFSAAAFSHGTVLFEDHFDDEWSLENWEFALPRDGIQDQKLYLTTCYGNTFYYLKYCNTYRGGPGENSAMLKQDHPERNFEFSVSLQPASVPVPGRLFLAAKDSQRIYTLSFVNSAWADQGDIGLMQFDHLSLQGRTSAAEANFAAVDTPATARIVAMGGTLNVFLAGKHILTYTDPDTPPALMIGLGPSDTEGGEQGTIMFDDVTLKALPDLRCSPDSAVDGKDRPCQDGLFDSNLWAYLGPDDERIAQVNFYLDGKFHRSEFRPPFELDGGRVSKLPNGPHEVKAKVFYRNGTRASFTAGFEVGEHSLRCSPDPVLDGNDGACEGGTFDAPTWVYWWPENGVKSVDYSMDSVLHRTERKAPFELDGGAASTSGGSVIRAVVQFKDGRRPLTVETHASWAVSGQEALLCSADSVLDGTDSACADYSGSWNSLPLQPIQVYLWPEDGIRYVDYYIDGAFHRTERYAPFELDGGAMTDLPAGTHDITAIVHYTDVGKPATAIRVQVFTFE